MALAVWHGLAALALAAVNLHVTGVSVHNGIPADGEQTYGRIDYTTTDLPSSASYVIDYRIDGVPVTVTRTSGAGLTSGTWAWISGGWVLTPGSHTLQITLDSTGLIAEADETDNTMTIVFSTAAPSTLPQKFRWPLAAAQASRVTTVNYVDVDPRSPTQTDYLGGPLFMTDTTASI